MPLFIKIAQLEIAASTEEFAKEMNELYNVLQTGLIDKDRLEIARKADRIFYSAEVNIEIEAIAYEAMLNIGDKTVHPESRLAKWLRNSR
ncbi:MAG: hypothetical protein NC923_01840 [Candidatus Omnitrophica bacterium]|nr:hypothetical protein [Candidatus Omnitrophota bacterium]